jgi:hypothetical protein
MRRSPAALEIQIDDVVQLRKPHPCGVNRWSVVRVGADIGLRCTGCQRRVLLSRRDFGHGLRTVLVRGTAVDAPSAPTSAG